MEIRVINGRAFRVVYHAEIPDDWHLVALTDGTYTLLA